MDRGRGVFSPFDRDVNRANHCHLLQPPAHPIPSHSNPIQSSLWLGHTYYTETMALKNMAKRTNYTDNSVNKSRARETILNFLSARGLKRIMLITEPTNCARSSTKTLPFTSLYYFNNATSLI